MRYEDNEIISGLYSPVRSSFEYELGISHISNNEIDRIDDILTFTNIRKTEEFDDPVLSETFYPNRQVKFNVDMDDIVILNEKKAKPNAKFKLKITNNLIESDYNDKLEDIKNALFKQNDKNVKNSGVNLTPDNIGFENAMQNKTDTDGNNLQSLMDELDD